MADLATYWRLGPAVTACRAADRILFLDAARDHYLALPADLTEPFAAWLETPGTGLADPCRSALAELAPGTKETVTPRRCQIGMPRPRDARVLAPRQPGMSDIAAVGREVFRAWRHVRTRPLAAIAEHRPQEPACPALHRADLETKLALFRSARPLIPVPRVCFHDCLALLRWIGPAAPHAALVFGVSATPFAAHCWVQAEGWVLDDHPESPSRFAPILHVQ